MIEKSIRKLTVVGASTGITLPPKMKRGEMFEVLCDAEKQVCLILPTKMSEKAKYEYIRKFESTPSV